MKVILSGATGYIGKRLLPLLLEAGHEVTCIVRDRRRFQSHSKTPGKLTVTEGDFLRPETLSIPNIKADIAFYLVHSMSSAIDRFEEMEVQSANNFVAAAKSWNVKQIIFLSGLQNAASGSPHLLSRLKVEQVLIQSGIPYTILRAGIIVGSGSASFEIIRDLTEKLPLMVTPRWLNTRCQPIAIRDVINSLISVMMHTPVFNRVLDIGGPDILTYKQMLLQYAEVRGLRRKIFILPLMTPRLSSYWLYFITSTSYKLAVNLVNSMKVEVICRENYTENLTGIKPLTYKESISLAFDKIARHHVVSSWKDALVSSSKRSSLKEYIAVPEFGCFHDVRQTEIKCSTGDVIANIWGIGGENGWYYADFLWKVRGYIDKVAGGIGLRRGRTNTDEIFAGDALDFWRVLLADKSAGRLLLYAEMKLPGEAWLEYKLIESNGIAFLRQTATFRPRGLSGRLYWYAVWPLHQIIFKGMNSRMAAARLVS